MALINCPECGKQISNKAISCPGCGLPASYFITTQAISAYPTNTDQAKESERIKTISSNNAENITSLASIHNALITFDQDYFDLFSPNEYIDSKKAVLFRNSYEPL